MDTDIVLLNMEIPRDVRDEFKIVAKRRRLSMSALLFQHIQRLIREEKERSPESFSDYDPPPKIVGESEFAEILMEALDGKELTPEKRRAIEIAVRTALEVQELTKDGTEIEK